MSTEAPVTAATAVDPAPAHTTDQNGGPTIGQTTSQKAKLTLYWYVLDRQALGMNCANKKPQGWINQERIASSGYLKSSTSNMSL
jgi:hypothetical protein